MQGKGGGKGDSDPSLRSSAVTISSRSGLPQPPRTLVRHIAPPKHTADGAVPHAEHTDVASWPQKSLSIVERQPQLTKRSLVWPRGRLRSIAELHHQSVGGRFSLRNLDPTHTAAALHTNLNVSAKHMREHPRPAIPVCVR